MGHHPSWRSDGGDGDVNRRRLLGIGIAIALLASVSGTGGFSSTVAERGVEVAVVDDDRAYLGIDQAGVNDGTWNVTMTNRLSSGTALDVTVSVAESTESVTLGPGESVRLSFTGVSCSDAVRVVGETDDGSVRIDADRTVTC